jgi:hypothetical protein
MRGSPGLLICVSRQDRSKSASPIAFCRALATLSHARRYPGIVRNSHRYVCEPLSYLKYGYLEARFPRVGTTQSWLADTLITIRSDSLRNRSDIGTGQSWECIFAPAVVRTSHEAGGTLASQTAGDRWTVERFDPPTA